MPKFVENLHTLDRQKTTASSLTDHHWYGDHAPANIRLFLGHSVNPVVQPEWLTQVKTPQSFIF